MFPVAEALSRRSESARAVFYTVTGIRKVANVSIERAVEVVMEMHGVDMAQFDNVIAMYKNCERDARSLMNIPAMCKVCPPIDP